MRWRLQGRGHWQLPAASEIQSPWPGVTRLGAGTVGREGASGGGEAACAQRAARPPAFPPLTLGPLLHPSPAARERGWRGASGVLAGLRLDWGRQGAGVEVGVEEGAHKRKEREKRSLGLRRALRKPALQLQQERIRAATTRCSQAQSKSCKNGNWKDGPSPQEWPFGSPSPHPFPRPRPKRTEKKGARLPREAGRLQGQLRLHPPRAGSCSIKPGNYAWPRPRSPPAQGAINVHGGEGGQEWPAEDLESPKARKQAARRRTTADPAGPREARVQSPRCRGAHRALCPARARGGWLQGRPLCSPAE